MSRHVCEAGETFLAVVDDAPSRPLPHLEKTPGLPEEIKRFRAELGMLQTALKCFRFYVIPESKA